MSYKKKPNGVYDVRDKEKGVWDFINFHLRELNVMFSYTGLPTEIPVEIMEQMIMTRGHAGFFEYDGKYYVLNGGYANTPDAYGVPINYIIANPYLNLSKEFERGKDVVVIKNDSREVGVLPLLERRGIISVESELSLYIALINSRMTELLAANSEREKDSAERFMKKVEAGELAILTDNPMLEGIKNLSSSSGNGVGSRVTSIIEAIQYNRGMLYNELGLSAPFNMKRERLTEDEVSLGDGQLRPIVDDMLACRERACDEINRIFGLNVSVKLSSSWKTVEQSELKSVGMNEPKPWEEPEYE